MIKTEFLKGNVAVLLGGESSEREVSLNSGQAVIEAFKRLGQHVIELDVKTSELPAAIADHEIKHCFIALHGGDGEDGTVQALLKSLGVTFTGSDHLGCGLAMDKYRTKMLWRGADIPTADFMAVSATDDWSHVSEALGSRMMIKPANEGSSIGMSVVESEAEFIAAVTEANRYDMDVIAEKWIEGKEYTVAVLGDRALPMIRLETDNSFYDYEAKYQSNDTRYIHPCGLFEKEEELVQSIALRAFGLLGCDAWGRIDVMEDGDGNFYLLEANTVPGMTDHSLVPMAAQAAGISFDELIAEIFNQSL